jgi:hypothetical protein
MKNFTRTLFLLIFHNALLSQTIAGFEEMNLPDSSFWNGSDGTAKGFTSGNAWFPTIWDTAFGGYWASGFALSTMRDTVSGNYNNPYSAITGKGYNGSASYVANYNSGYFLLKGAALGKQLNGAYLTNGTYSYKSMLKGDAFSKKFGGENGNAPDYLRLIFKGYLQGIEKEDSVVFYLADFRSSDNANDYILKDWTWADFSSLGNVDSVRFYFESSDVGQFGINTPLYFYMDNLITADSPAGVAQVSNAGILHVYPNPTTGVFHIDAPDSSHMEIMNISGQTLIQQNLSIAQNTIDLSFLPAGIYLIRAGTMVQKLVLKKP